MTDLIKGIDISTIQGNIDFKIKNCTVYLLINTINNKVYVGQTWKSLEKRWMSGHGYKGCIFLQNAITKYGKDKFYYQILCMASSQKVADYLEDHYINEYNSRDNNTGYNIRNGGSRGKFAHESKLKLSKSLKEWHKNNPDALKGERNPMFGKILTKERLETFSKVKRGNRNYFYGKHHTKETKIKISKSKKFFSDEKELEIYKEYKTGAFSMKKLANKHNVSTKLIFNIIRRTNNV